MRPSRSREEQILVWCGVVTQLNHTRTTRILGDSLPHPLFILLRHFCHDPDREWTVTQLAAAFEVPQPGITKKIKRLLDAKLLTSRDDPDDARVHWLRVTARGKKLRDRLSAKLVPDQKRIFRDWSASDIAALHRGLERLKSHLDDNREDIEAG